MKLFYIVGLGILLLGASTAAAYQENRTLALEAKSIGHLRIDCGAGELRVEGVDGLAEINVEALIIVERTDEDEAVEFLEKNLELELVERGSGARLICEIDNDNLLFWRRINAKVDLVVRVPRNMALDITDGSGNIFVQDIDAAVIINDGSGNIKLADMIGEVRMDDGSGEILLTNITGSVTIDDGSGDIEAEQVVGDIDINDGSGNIMMSKITGDVFVEDGSGNMAIDGVDGDVDIEEAGSGEVDITNVTGRVRK